MQCTRSNLRQSKIFCGSMPPDPAPPQRMRAYAHQSHSQTPPQKGGEGVCKFGPFPWFGRLGGRADTAVVKQTLDLIGRQLWAHGPTIQIYIAGNGAAIGESYDYAKAAISLEYSNTFLQPKDCVQIHQTLSPLRGWSLGTRLMHRDNSLAPPPLGKLSKAWMAVSGWLASTEISTLVYIRLQQSAQSYMYVVGTADHLFLRFGKKELIPQARDPPSVC